MDSLSLQQMNEPLLRWLSSLADDDDHEEEQGGDHLALQDGVFLHKVWQQIDHCSQLQQLSILPDNGSNTVDNDQQQLRFLRPLQQVLGTSLPIINNSSKAPTAPTNTTITANISKNNNNNSTSNSAIHPNLNYARAIHALLFRILRFYEHNLGQLPVLPLPDPFAIAQLPPLKLLRCTESSSSPLVESPTTSGRSSPVSDKGASLDFSRVSSASSANLDVKIVDASSDLTKDAEKSCESTKEKSESNSTLSHVLSTVHSDLESIDSNQNHCDHPEPPEQHLHTFLLLLLGCAVQCDRKEQFIERIKQLDLQTQHALIPCIQRVTDNPSSMWLAAEWPSLSAVPDLTPERVYRLLLSHLKGVCTQRQQLLARCAHLLDRLNQLRNVCSRCATFSTANLSSLSDCLGSCFLHCGLHSITSLTSEDRSITALDDSSTGAANTSSQRLTAAAAEELLHQLRCQLREARAELDERTEQLTETQEQLRQCRESNTKQAAEHVRLTQQAREAKMYRDEVDVLNERLRAMQAAEEELDRYRARRAEFERAQRQSQQLIEENRLLTEAKQVCQEQLNRAQQRLEATTELETQLVQARACVAELKAQRDDDRQRLSALCDRIAELEAERRLADERLADCQAQLREARLAASSASSNHSNDDKNNQNNSNAKNCEESTGDGVGHSSGSINYSINEIVAQPNSFALTEATFGEPLANVATGNSLLEQLNNENAKRLLQLEIENQKLQCALTAERAKKTQRRLEANNATGGNSSNENKSKLQSGQEFNSIVESKEPLTTESSGNRFGVLDVADEDTQSGNNTSNNNNSVLSSEAVAIGTTNAAQLEHTSESDSGCVSLVGESTCIKCRRSVSDRSLSSLAAVHLCNNQPIRSGSSASSSSGSADSSVALSGGGSSSSGHNSEEESNGSLSATDRLILSSRRDSHSLKGSPIIARTSANTAVLRPIRQISEIRPQSSMIIPSLEQQKASESLPACKVHSIVQTESPTSVQHDRFRSVSTSTNSLPSSPAPSPLRTTPVRSSVVPSSSVRMALVEGHQTPPPKLPPRSQQPTPPKPIIHAPNCRLGHALSIATSQSVPSYPPSSSSISSVSSLCSSSSGSSMAGVGSLMPAIGFNNTNGQAASTTTIQNHIAINFNGSTVSNANTAPGSSVYVRNDVQRTCNGTRRTVQMTTTTGPTSGGQQKRSTVVNDRMSNGSSSSTFISVSSTLNQTPPKRPLPIVSPTSTTAAFPLTSITHVRQPSLPGTVANGTIMQSPNGQPNSTAGYRNPNFVRGTFRSYNFGHHGAVRPDYALVKHEPVRPQITTSSPISSSSAAHHLRTRPETLMVPNKSNLTNRTLNNANNGGAFTYLTSSISSPSLNSDSEEEDSGSTQPTRPTSPHRKMDLNLISHHHQQQHLSQSINPTTIRRETTTVSNNEASPLRRSRTLMLNSNGKPEVGRKTRNSEMPNESNSGLSSPVSTLSAKSVWYEYGCV